MCFRISPSKMPYLNKTLFGTLLQDKGRMKGPFEVKALGNQIFGECI